LRRFSTTGPKHSHFLQTGMHTYTLHKKKLKPNYQQFTTQTVYLDICTQLKMTEFK